MFYVMLALRAELRRRGRFPEGKEPNLAALTDLVALGTIADVVPLDANNRNLVSQGLKRLRAGRCAPGIAALLRAAGRALAEASSFDLGFVVGPRLNAAGRLADMSLGIECLITEDEARAANCAQELDRLNRERRSIEASMLELAALEQASGTDGNTFFHPEWHQGVVGIVASRLKDRLHRPVICFAGPKKRVPWCCAVPGAPSRVCICAMRSTSFPSVRRGSSAVSAAMRWPRATIAAGDYERFAGEFERTVEEFLPPDARLRVVETDGALDAMHFSLEVARLLDAGIWGQGFPQPVFCDTFLVENQRVVGERHLKAMADEERPPDRGDALRRARSPSATRARGLPPQRQRVQRPEEHPAQRGALRMIRTCFAGAALAVSGLALAADLQPIKDAGPYVPRRRAWSPTCCATPTSVRTTS